MPNTNRTNPTAPTRQRTRRGKRSSARSQHQRRADQKTRQFKSATKTARQWRVVERPSSELKRRIVEGALDYVLHGVEGMGARAKLHNMRIVFNGIRDASDEELEMLAREVTVESIKAGTPRWHETVLRRLHEYRDRSTLPR